MAKLTLTSNENQLQWLEINPLLKSGDSNQEHLSYEICLFPGPSGKPLRVCERTDAWQIGRIYIEVIATTFERIDSFCSTYFPVSYYSDPSAGPPIASLHNIVGSLHIFVRGMPRERVAIHVFLETGERNCFFHIDGRSNLDDAKQFGRELKAELQAVFDPGNRSQ